MQDKKEMPTERVGIYKTDKGTLINKDNEALKAYKKKKAQTEEIDKLKKNFNDLKNDIDEIKQMLKNLNVREKI